MNRKGYTLVELMVGIGILLILTMFLISHVAKTRASADEVLAQTVLRRIADALEQYQQFNDSYPADPAQLLAANPPYINKDYFSQPIARYTFASVLQNYTYTVTATPVNNGSGRRTFAITTGGVLQNP